MTPQPVPEGSIIITPAQVYEKVTTLTDVVTRMVARDEADKESKTALAAEVTALAVRVSAIEKKIWMVTGAAAAAGGVLGSWLPAVLGQ